jgi:hypothetical protein
MLLSKSLSFKMRLGVILIVLFISIILILLGLDKVISVQLSKFGVLGAVVAGAFYTFGISTPMAMAVIIDMMQMDGALSFALTASITAATVDCVLFSVMRDTLESNSKKLLQNIRKNHKWLMQFSPAIGFFIFGLPLPDELALALLEITKINLSKLWAVVFLAKLITLILIWKVVF